MTVQDMRYFFWTTRRIKSKKRYTEGEKKHGIYNDKKNQTNPEHGVMVEEFFKSPCWTEALHLAV